MTDLMTQSTAVVLAGGKSSRMGRNKALIDIDGRPMIARIVDQLTPNFGHLMIGAADDGTYDFLELPIVPDLKPGCGPLMGIASALTASRTELTFVMACDVPTVDDMLIRSLFDGVGNHPCAVPRSTDGFPEPLFAVYRRSVLPTIMQMLEEECLRVSDLFGRVDALFLDLDADRAVINLNTPNDLENWKETRRDIV